MAINMRALDIPLALSLPKMDLTALYCLGTAVQEYTRHLSTNIMTQKLASENQPQLNTLFTEEEINSRKLTAIIDKYKLKTPVKPLSSTVYTRPSIQEELSYVARSKKYHQNNPFSVDVTIGDTYYEKMLRAPDWRNVLRKNRNPEAAAAAAKIRRENDEEKTKKAKQKKKAKEEQEQKEIQQQQEPVRIKQEKKSKHKHHIPTTHVKQEYVPLSPPLDIFDRELQSQSKPKLKSKSKRNISSSNPSSSPSKKRKKASHSFH